MKPKPVATAANPDRLRYLRWGLWLVLVLLAVSALPVWNAMAARFGPMSRHESQCLICHRERIEETLCGEATADQIIPNECSDWIDTFVPADHEHVWMVSTSYYRPRWFGNKSIACGGIGVLSWIKNQRGELGEEKCRQLVLKFHELVRDPSAAHQLADYDRFGNAVMEDPDSLLVEVEDVP